jgi:hypothetical protein
VEKGAAVLRGVNLPAEQCERRRQTALDVNLGQHLRPGSHGPHWAADELALLGTMPDEQVAAETGRTIGAVKVMRGRQRRNGQGDLLDWNSRPE